MRYAPSLLDKLIHISLIERPGEVLPGLTLEEVKDSVAADLEALLNTRCALDDDDRIEFPLSVQSVVNYGVDDFSSRSLSSGLDRDFICSSIQRSIEQQDRRLRSVSVSLDSEIRGINRLDFTIRATLRVSDIGEQVSFDARFEPTVQRYTVARQSSGGR
ncbi:MAG: type VI secretion system baseplate subunit TssE [Burkholderiales bacterium]|nr:type VI secretion system baseplate subunit TssE [Burkholderiales bacterium]